MRIVICHYHIYKNAGTSFDHLLKENFGDRHASFDGPFPFFTIHQDQLARIIQRQPHLIALSSHQIRLPVPTALDFLVLPVVFIRHPLLRIQSIYKFKRQAYDGTETSKNARSLSFDEWVKRCFSSDLELAHVSNAQTRILGAAYQQRRLIQKTENGMKCDLNQAIRNLQNVPLLARTEYFDEDVVCFPEILRRFGVEFTFTKSEPKNITSDTHQYTLGERLSQVRNSLSEDTYHTLLKFNFQDLRLLECASQLIGSAKSNPARSDSFFDQQLNGGASR